MYFRYTQCVAERLARKEGPLMSACFLAATCARDVMSSGAGSSSQVRHLGSPLKLCVVKSSGRTWTRQPVRASERDRCYRRIKYHNASGTSIGIRCNQFGGGPKAAACKSSLQGISVGDTDGNQTPSRGQWSVPCTSIPYELDFQRTRIADGNSGKNPFERAAIITGADVCASTLSLSAS